MDESRDWDLRGVDKFQNDGEEEARKGKGRSRDIGNSIRARGESRSRLKPGLPTLVSVAHLLSSMAPTAKSDLETRTLSRGAVRSSGLPMPSPNTLPEEREREN